MSRYSLEVRPAVLKTLRKIRDPKLQQRLDEAFNQIAGNPRRRGVEKLAGVEDRYRLRVSNFRIVFEIHDDRLLVLILAVGDRKDIYR